MRIAIDCRLWAFPDAVERFFGAALVPFLIKKAPEHQFYLVFDQSPGPEWKAFENAVCIVLKPQPNSAAARGLWYDIRMPALLSAHKIDFFLGASGYISLRSPVKQAILLHDALNAENPPPHTGWPGSWYRRRLPSMLAKAALRVVPALSQAKTLPGVFDRSYFRVLPSWPLWPVGFNPGSIEKDAVKAHLTGGYEYFLCIEGWQTLDDAVELLLAFSAFKKRQQTSMKLVLMGQPPEEKEWKEKMETFRYREEVVLFTYPKNKTFPAETLCAAYAMIHLPSVASTIHLQQALSAGVPVITWPHETMQEVAGDAPLYCTDAPGESLAHNMMRMYKDENMRNALLLRGLQISGDWHPDRVAEELIRLCTLPV